MFCNRNATRNLENIYNESFVQINQSFMALHVFNDFASSSSLSSMWWRTAAKLTQFSILIEVCNCPAVDWGAAFLYTVEAAAAFNQWFQSMGLFATRLTFCPPDTQQDKASSQFLKESWIYSWVKFHLHHIDWFIFNQRFQSMELFATWLILCPVDTQPDKASYHF